MWYSHLKYWSIYRILPWVLQWYWYTYTPNLYIHINKGPCNYVTLNAVVNSVAWKHHHFCICPFSPPWQISQCASGPNSVNHDFSRASVRDPGGLVPPAYMSSLRSGYEELGPEQLERLQQDVNNIKNNYRRTNVSDKKILKYWCILIIVFLF